jgi:hypothetical protein
VQVSHKARVDIEVVLPTNEKKQNAFENNLTVKRKHNENRSLNLLRNSLIKDKLPTKKYDMVFMGPEAN